MTKIVTSTILVATLALTSPAKSQTAPTPFPAGTTTQPAATYILDAHGVMIGPIAQTGGWVQHHFGAFGPYFMAFSRTGGVQQNPTYVYQEDVSNKCAGQKYFIMNDEFPTQAYFDGQTVRAQAQNAQPVAYGYKSLSWFGQCYTNSDVNAALVAPTIIDTTFVRSLVTPYRQQ